MPHDLVGDRADDALVDRHQVVPAHLAGTRDLEADDDHVGALGLLVAVRADETEGLVAEHRRGLVDVEGLALRQPFLDVDDVDVRVVALGDLLRGGGADVAGTDHRHLASQTRTPILSMIASATSLVPTAVGSSRVGFMS